MVTLCPCPWGKRLEWKLPQNWNCEFLRSSYWSSRWFVPLCMFYWQCYAFLLKYKQCRGGYLIVLSNLHWEQTQDFLSSGIPLIQCLLCQTLNKLESLMCWHALWAHPKFSVFKAPILQFTHCSWLARLRQFWAVKLWSPEQEGCQSQSEGFP